VTALRTGQVAQAAGVNVQTGTQLVICRRSAIDEDGLLVHIRRVLA